MTTVVEALAEVMRSVGHVAKADRNEHQRFLFRGIDAVMNAVGPALRQHGVVVMPDVQTITYDTVQTTTGKASTACRVVVKYRFHGPDGDHIDATVAGEAWDHGDKATPKAMSVAFRTALLQALTLPTDEKDPDVDHYEHGGQDTYDWRGEADAVPDVEEARALWTRAKAAGADEADLNYITAKARSFTPPDKPTGQAIADGEPPRRNTPHGSATQKQVGMVNGLLKKSGYETDEQRYARLSEMTGREIGSSNELSKTEASRIIDELDPKPAEGDPS